MSRRFPVPSSGAHTRYSLLPTRRPFHVRVLIILLLAIVLLLAVASRIQADPPDILTTCPAWQPPASTSYRAFPSPGVYPFLDWPHLERKRFPWLTGGHNVFPWNTIEDLNPAQRYWEELDQWIATEASLGKKVALAFNTYDGACCGGDRLPTWFKQAHGPWPNGDGYVTCTWTDRYGTHTEDIPMYWSEAYLAAFEDFIEEAAERYRDDPRVAWVEVSTGVYGETTPAESDEELRACLQSAGLTWERWLDTMNQIVAFYQKHWQETPLLTQYAPWYLDRRERREHTDFAGSIGVGMKHNKVAVDYDDQVIRSDTVNVNDYICRTGQHDPMLSFAGQVPIAWEGESILFDDPSDTLWGFLNALDKHPTYLLIGKNTVRSQDPLEQWVLGLAARYAGRTIADTPGVWVALRDPKPAPPGQPPRWYPQWGNFNFWLRQDDTAAGGRTVPDWEVTSEPWGRYTRRTDQTTGNPNMVFDIDDSYALEHRGSPTRVTAIYLDYGNDTWELQYDAAGIDNYRSAGVVRKSNSGLWREVSFLLSDAEFANQQDGYDFRILSRNDGDEFISFVEVSHQAEAGGGAVGPVAQGVESKTTERANALIDEGGAGAVMSTVFDQSLPSRPNSAPDHDDIGQPRAIAGFPFQDAADISSATVAADDPDMGCGEGTNANTVWYRFVAPEDGFVNANTVGSGYDTVVAAWQGTRGSLDQPGGEACNDDAGWWAESSNLNFPVTAGQAYYLEVASYGAGHATVITGDTNLAAGGSSDGGNLALRATFHTCTYASDEATVQAILDQFGLDNFDNYIDYVAAPPSANAASSNSRFSQQEQPSGQERCAIVGFHLPAYELEGTLPASLGTLSNLQQLDLQGNRFSDPWPASLGNLSNLQTLDVRRNRFEGSPPSLLANLANLQQLAVSNNRFDGELPAFLSNLTNLQVLQASKNEFSGPVPAWLGSLTNLRQLWLGYNRFNGPIPPQLGDLGDLQMLSLAHNQLEGQIPDSIGGLDSLQVLHLSNNDLRGRLTFSDAPAGTPARMSSLRYLYVDHNRLEGPLSTGLGDLAALEVLHLEGNQISGSLPPELGSLSQLASLHLGDNLLTGGVPNSLSQLDKLEGLYLDHNLLGGPLPSSLANLAGLRRLTLNHTLLNGSLPSAFSALSDLWTLHMQQTELCEPADAAVQGWLGSLYNLQSDGATCQLVLEKWAEPAQLPADGSLVYRISLHNETSENIRGVVLQDTLPSGVTLLLAEPPPDSTTGPELTWQVGTLLPAEGFAVELAAQSTGSEGYLLNQAAAGGQQGEASLVDSAWFALGQVTASAPTPTPTASPTATPKATRTATASPSRTPSRTPTATPTAMASATATPTATSSLTPTTTPGTPTVSPSPDVHSTYLPIILMR